MTTDVILSLIRWVPAASALFAEVRIMIRLNTMPITFVFCVTPTLQIRLACISGADASKMTCHCSDHVNGKLAATEPGKEIRNADGQIQNTRFHEDTNEELELFRGGVVFAFPGCFPDPPNQNTWPGTC
jgi:hypothetical protein